MVWARCTRAGCTKRFWGSTAKSAKSALCRHVRECHMPHGKARATRRRASHQKYKLLRKPAQAPRAATDATLFAFVLCPLRREQSHDMCTQTEVDLMAGGFTPGQIRRLQGYDLQNPTSWYYGQRLPERVKSHQCCRLAFHVMCA